MHLPPALPRAFSARSPLDLAPALIGTLLCHLVDGTLVAALIVETEAYLGPEDRASHARAGRTARTQPMFGPPGHAYVYRLYGMHWAFNVVGHTDQDPAGAVLIRAALPVAGLDAQRRLRGRPSDPVPRLAAGPARLCQALGIVGADSGRDLTMGPPLWLAAMPSEPPEEWADAGLAPGNGPEYGPDASPGPLRTPPLLQGPRVNVDYAGEPWTERPYRFGLAGSPALSRPFPGPGGRRDV
ncbi:MAG: DNA-3-methyladenine glycosylase [Candidatus Limnocylindrales bacterium]